MTELERLQEENERLRTKGRQLEKWFVRISTRFTSLKTARLASLNLLLSAETAG